MKNEILMRYFSKPNIVYRLVYLNKLKNTHKAKRLPQPAIALMSTKFWAVINSFSMCFLKIKRNFKFLL